MVVCGDFRLNRTEIKALTFHFSLFLPNQPVYQPHCCVRLRELSLAFYLSFQIQKDIFVLLSHGTTKERCSEPCPGKKKNKQTKTKKPRSFTNVSMTAGDRTCLAGISFPPNSPDVDKWLGWMLLCNIRKWRRCLADLTDLLR